MLAIVTFSQPQLLHQRHIFRWQELLGSIINPAHDFTVMNIPLHRYRRFLIQARTAPHQHLLQQGAPFDAAAPLFGHLAVIYVPAVSSL
ncbi:hypothetical protein D3C79_620310 [compost metagenome]